MDKISSKIEIERKYIVKMPVAEQMEKCDGYTKSEIVQIYLPSDGLKTHRIRKRCYGDRTEYIETVKIRLDNMSSDEFEREISKDEYESLAERIKDGTRPIVKTRHTFIFEGQLFEIDVYPEWQSCAIMETELAKRDTAVAFPTFIKTIREVTGDRRYSNASMAKQMPKEDI